MLVLWFFLQGLWLQPVGILLGKPSSIPPACHSGGALANWRLAKLNNLMKKCGGQALSGGGGVTVVLTGEIVAGPGLSINITQS